MTSRFSFILVSLATAASFAAAERFEVSFPGSAHSQAITGRVYVFLTKDGARTAPPGGLLDRGDPVLRSRCRSMEGRAGCSDRCLDARLSAQEPEGILVGDYFVQALVNYTHSSIDPTGM